VAFDRTDEVAIVPVNRVGAIVQLIPREQVGAVREREAAQRASVDWEITDMRGTPYVMRRRLLLGPGMTPCTPPPFGALVAVSLRTGEKAWEVPLGTPGPLGAALPDGGAGMGSPNLGGPIATAGGLVFIAGTLDPFLRAFDTRDGRELWRGELPAGGKATPMTYSMGGRQFVVVAAGGDGGAFGRSDAIVAFALQP
jgi:quinoprotein glucose dehydrogenase